MAVSAKDSKLLEQKDLISQLNTTIAAQTELIQSLKKDHEADREQIQNLLAQVDYLTKKLFGTSSEKMKDVEGQLNLFDEAEQEAEQEADIDLTITLKQGQDTMQLISLMVFRTDTWKRMVIRVIIISLVSGAAPAGRIQEDTSLMRFQKESSMITAIRQYRESSSVQSFLSMSADHRTRSTHLSREKPIVLKKKNRYSTRSGTGLTSRSHVREAISRQR